MFWIFIWVVLSAIILGASLWSLQILLRQKKAWESFAKRHNLSYNPGKFMAPAEMTGVIGDIKVSFFTAERLTTDIRGRKYVSALELQCAAPMFDGGVAGTKEMMVFMQSLSQLHPYIVKHEGWDKAFNIFVREDAPADVYFTPERIESFTQVLKTRNADVLIVFSTGDLLIRLETSDPMMDAAKIEKIITRQMALMQKMR